MSLPVIYRKSSEGAVASYDYVDIAEGTGIVKFYSGGTADNAGIKLKLDRNVFYCAGVSPAASTRYTKIGFTDANFAKKIEVTFNSAVFNLPQTIKGTMTSCISVTTIGSTSDSCNQYYIIQTLSKVDAADGATELAVTQSNTIDYAQAAGPDIPYATFLTTVPLTLMKKGEKIRIKIEVWCKHAGGTNDHAVLLCYDPLNNEVKQVAGWTTQVQRISQAAGYTQTYFLIPFRIDL